MTEGNRDAEFYRIMEGNIDEDEAPVVDWRIFEASLDPIVNGQPERGFDDYHLSAILEKKYGLTIEEAFQAIKLGKKQERPDGQA